MIFLDYLWFVQAACVVCAVQSLCQQPGNINHYHHHRYLTYIMRASSDYYSYYYYLLIA